MAHLDMRRVACHAILLEIIITEKSFLLFILLLYLYNRIIIISIIIDISLLFRILSSGGTCRFGFFFRAPT